MTIINNNTDLKSRGIADKEIEESFTLFFPKKTASGTGVSWISKEQYLRNDITCKYLNCQKCKSLNGTDNNDTGINNNNINESLKGNQLLLDHDEESNVTTPTIIIPDINTICDYLEVFELVDTSLRNIVILETIYKHVQYNSGPKFFDRLKQLVNQSDKSCCYFSNELFIDTFTERSPKDTVSEYQNKIICNAVKWYNNHFNNTKNKKSTTYKIILLCNDSGENQLLQEMAINQSIETMTLSQYLESLGSGKNMELLELYDSINQLLIEKKKQQELSGGSGNDSNSLFTRYLNDDILNSELKSGNILAGKIHFNSHNRDESFVKLSMPLVETGNGSNDEDSSETLLYGDKVMIIGKFNQNRAVHGDKVGISLLPESEWLPYDSSIKLDYQQDDDIDYQGSDEMDGGITGGRKKKLILNIPTGRVVGIFQRNWRDYVGTVEKNTSSFTNFLMVVPFDWRIPLIRVPTKNPLQYVGKRLIVRMDSWDLNSNYPIGHYVGTIGESGSLETELSALMVEHDISLKQWPTAILKSLPESSESQPWQIPDKELQYRRDMSSHHVMSIDPLGSKDIDDAISIGYPSEGIIEIGVHIADVSHFVREGSALDIEARRRGTTIYLPDRRFDMLPAVLSEDICSLRGGLPRCAMSVVWQIRKGTAEILNTWFGRTVIHSSGELHYQLAQDIIDGKVVDGKDKDSDVTHGGTNAGYRNRVYNGLKIKDIKKDLLVLLDVFRLLKGKRSDDGALDLESIEVRFQFTGKDTSKPDKIILKNDLEIHQLVAEYMILANSSVATKIHSAYPSCSLLRRHPKPNQINFESIKSLFAHCGFELNTSTNKQLAESLKHAIDSDDGYINQILKLKTVNVVSEAVYFSTGSVNNINEFIHYGLALNKYTHFTSPIRRYSDIIVHRQLWNSLIGNNGNNGNTVNQYDNYSMNILAEHLNIRHRASKTVQRDATELFQSLYFKIKPKDNVQAIVTDIRSNGFAVFVPEFGLRQRVFLTKDSQYILPTTCYPAEEYGQVSNIEFNELNLKIQFTQSSKIITLAVFDHVLVNIHTEDDNYHLPPIKLDLIKILTKKLNPNKPQKKKQQEKKQQQQQDLNVINGEFKDKSKLLDEIKQSEKHGGDDNNILLDPESKQFKQSTSDDTNSINLFNLVQQFSNLKMIKENGSKINYNLGKSLKSNKPTVTTTTTTTSSTTTDRKPVLKLWSMTESECKQYKKKSEQDLRDLISSKYHKDDGIDIGGDEVEMIGPNLTVKDKYREDIAKAENDLRKSNFKAQAAKKKW